MLMDIQQNLEVITFIKIHDFDVPYNINHPDADTHN